MKVAHVGEELRDGESGDFEDFANSEEDGVKQNPTFYPIEG